MRSFSCVRFLLSVALPAAVAVSASGEPAAAGRGNAALSFAEVWGALPTITGGHGVMFADVHDDGFPDLYLPLNYTPQLRPDLFVRNDGAWQLVEDGVGYGIPDVDEGSHGAVWADLDNDGDYDLVNGTTYGATNWNNVFRNDGVGGFTEITPGTLQTRTELTRCVLAFDMDADGDLDIYGVTNSGGSSDPPSERNELWRNDGSFQFTEITSGPLYDAPCGQGATDTDYDGDGDIDVFAANRTGAVNIFRNDGGGSFSQLAPGALGITNLGKDGIATADIDNDDDLDLLLSGNAEGHLYRNDGPTTFTHLRSFTGTDGYMGGFADLDNDGDLDLVFAGEGIVHLNDGAGTFTSGPTVPLLAVNDPRGIAFADLDRDGDLDFAVGVKGSRNALYRNDFGSGNWLEVRLVSPHGQAGAFGARTRLYAAGDVGGTLLGLRESKSNYGYLAQDDPVLHFGLGGRTSVDVVVTFLDGTLVTRLAVGSNQLITVEGGDPTGAAGIAEAAGALLEPNHPNPFRGPTAIRWRLPEGASVDLAVYDALGRRVRTLVSGRRGEGTHGVVWDGRDGRGRLVPSGVYFYRLATDRGRESRKMTVLR